MIIVDLEHRLATIALTILPRAQIVKSRAYPQGDPVITLLRSACIYFHYERCGVRMAGAPLTNLLDRCAMWCCSESVCAPKSAVHSVNCHLRNKAIQSRNPDNSHTLRVTSETVIVESQ